MTSCSRRIPRPLIQRGGVFLGDGGNFAYGGRGYSHVDGLKTDSVWRQAGVPGSSSRRVFAEWLPAPTATPSPALKMEASWADWRPFQGHDGMASSRGVGGAREQGGGG